MKLRADFGLFLIVAFALHVVAFSITQVDVGETQGTAGSGGVQASAMSEDLAALVETWETEPVMAAPTDQEVRDPIEETTQAPTQMDVKTPEVIGPKVQTPDNPTELPRLDAPNRPTTETNDQQLAEVQPIPVAPIELNQQSDETSVKIPVLPTIPSAPDAIQVNSRQDEPDPDPNEIKPEIASLSQTAPSQPLDTSPRPVTDERPEIAALKPPEVVALPDQTPFKIPQEVVPEETGPAPVSARLPIAKPQVPEWAVAERREAAKRAEARREQKAKPKREAKPKQRQVVKQESPEPRQPSQTTGTAKAPDQSSGSTSSGQQQAALGTGSGTSNQGNGFSAAEISDAKSRYVSAVRRAILKKRRYPKKAQRRKIEGRPVVRVTLDAGGRLLGAELAASSGSDLLDNAALAAVRAVSRFPRIPEEMSRTKATIKFGINFQRK